MYEYIIHMHYEVIWAISTMTATVFVLRMWTMDGGFMIRYLVLCTVNNSRNSADADKWRDAFRGQSWSPNMVPFDMLCMVSY